MGPIAGLDGLIDTFRSAFRAQDATGLAPCYLHRAESFLNGRPCYSRNDTVRRLQLQLDRGAWRQLDIVDTLGAIDSAGDGWCAWRAEMPPVGGGAQQHLMVWQSILARRIVEEHLFVDCPVVSDPLAPQLPLLLPPRFEFDAQQLRERAAPAAYGSELIAAWCEAWNHQSTTRLDAICLGEQATRHAANRDLWRAMPGARLLLRRAWSDDSHAALLWSFRGRHLAYSSPSLAVEGMTLLRHSNDRIVDAVSLDNAADLAEWASRQAHHPLHRPT